MKSIVNNTPIKQSAPYPKLMLNKNNGAIWLMLNGREGTIITRGSSLFVEGEHSANLDAKGFVDFEGSVTLSND